jgi:hypothetical protein
MKTPTLLILFVAILFAFSSCSSDKGSQNISSSVSDSKKETRGVKGIKSFGKFSSLENTYIDLKIDGTFEASFENDEIIKGNWKEDSEAKTLTLNTEKSSDGKGKSYIKVFTIIEKTSEKLKLVDSEGKKIEMSAE